MSEEFPWVDQILQYEIITFLRQGKYFETEILTERTGGWYTVLDWIVSYTKEEAADNHARYMWRALLGEVS